MLPNDRTIIDGGEAKEREFLQNLCVKDFLKNDEESYYNSILKDLRPDEKWIESSTETYIGCVIDEFTTNEIDEAVKRLLEIENYVYPQTSKHKISDSKSKSKFAVDQRKPKQRSKTQ